MMARPKSRCICSSPMTFTSISCKGRHLSAALEMPKSRPSAERPLKNSDSAQRDAGYLCHLSRFLRSIAEVWAQPLPAGTHHRVGKYASAACYSPDGMYIVYADGHSLMMINRDGSDPRELARVKEVVRQLRYSPDGERIRFQIMTRDQFDRSSLWPIDVNGESLHPLLPNWKQSALQCCGNWSPDGEFYFFQGGHGIDQAIWVMPEQRFNFAGAPGSPSPVISGPLRLSGPVPSADGKRLFVMGQDLRAEPSPLRLENTPIRVLP